MGHLFGLFVWIVCMVLTGFLSIIIRKHDAKKKIKT